MRRAIPATFFLLACLLLAPLPARAASDCQFVLGFATLHDLIPNVVGQCLDNETHNPVNGDGLQLTTNGLLVWRKADNHTAFTNGVQTWVNGPFGLQMRLNDQRFFWEENPDRLPIVPPPVPGDRCHTAGLSLGVGPGNAGAGHAGFVMQLINETDVPCTFYGYVGAQLLDADFNPLPTTVIRGGGYLFPDRGPTLFTVAPGDFGAFGLEWEDVPVGNETTCPTSSYVAVIPPDEYDPLISPLTAMACGGGTLHVTAMHPPGPPSSMSP